jgi:predicted ATPase/DNA-binding CsgD family transcriptional regulator
MHPAGSGQIRYIRPMLTRARSLVGRDKEVAELGAALAGARAGRGSAVFVSGEPGVGKTRLAAEAASRAAERGMLVLRGRGSVIGPMVPYRPLTEALLALSRTRALPADGSLGPYRPVLGHLVPDWAEAGTVQQPVSPVILAEAVLRLTAALGRSTGCLLVLDDLQDADAETLAVVDYLTDNVGQQPAVLLCTLRSDPSDALTVATNAAQRGSGAILALDRLGRGEVYRMVASCLEITVEDVPPEVGEELWDSSVGVPFVVEELLQSMIASGHLVRSAGGWQSVGRPRLEVPASLMRTLTRRTDQLEPQGRQVLSAAAVLGRRFPLAVLQEVTGLDDRGLLGTLRSGIPGQLVAPDELTPDWYTFRHPLTAEGLLAQLTPAERSSLAGRVAGVVESRYPGLPGEWCPLVAALRQDAGEKLAAGRLFVEAGRRALGEGAASSAGSLLERAEDLLAGQSDVDAQADLLESLLPALAEAGQFDKAFRRAGTIDALVRAGLDQRRGAALHTRLARAACLAGRTAEAEAQLSAARGLLGPVASDADLAAINAVAALVLLGVAGGEQVAQAAELAQRAAESAPVPEIAFDCWQALGLAARLNDLAESDHYFERAREVAERGSLPTLRAYALIRLGSNAWLGECDTGPLQVARQEASRLGLVVMVYNVDANLALHAVLTGAYGRAVELLEQCWPTVVRLRVAVLARHLLSTRATLAAHRGRRREMEAALGEFAAWGGEESAEQSLALGMARAFCALLEEDRELAREDLAAAAAVEASHPSAYYLAGGHGLALLLDVLAGDAGVAEYEAVASRTAARMRWNRQFVQLAQAVLLGRAGDTAGAADALGAALASAQPYPLAKWLGIRLVTESAVGDGWADDTLLRGAEEYFHRAEIPTVASACRALLRQLGAPVQQRRAGTDRVPGELRALGVTLREYEVLELLVERLTNKAIATRLHISPRTVEKHVASLIMKTDQPGRAALSAHAAKLLSP